jgi:hypothetical protein
MVRSPPAPAFGLTGQVQRGRPQFSAGFRGSFPRVMCPPAIDDRVVRVEEPFRFRPSLGIFRARRWIQAFYL